VLQIRLIPLFLLMVLVGCKQEEKMAGDSDIPLTKEDFLLGRYDPSTHPDFIVIEPKYADKEGMMLQKKAYQAFLQLADAGEKAGHSFCILSATRNFSYQKYIWENKWYGFFPINGNVDACTAYPDELERAKKIMEYSAMPGTSRHHWGTDIDINELENEYFETGDGAAWYQWMKENAHKFGFYQPYSAGRTIGYKEEKWHWTYLPLSKQYTQQIQQIITDEMINGFAGSEYSDQLDIVERYILGIADECK
jgi:D-alanyl-D-alanine carboxypeptidase